MTKEENNSGSEQSGIDRRTALKGGVAGIGLLGLGALGSGGAAASGGADKVSVTGSTYEVMEVSRTDTSNQSSVHTLLETDMKTSSPTDLIFQPTLETSLYTDLVTELNSSAEAMASIKGWIEVDGEPVIVSSNHPPGMSQQEAAEVVFDRREHRMIYDNFDDPEDETVEHFLRTRSTNGFNWIDLDMGSGTHHIALKGQLDVYADESSEARAVVGSRTLVIDPVKLSNDAEI